MGEHRDQREVDIADLDEHDRAYLLGWLKGVVGDDEWLSAVRATRADRGERRERLARLASKGESRGDGD